MIHYYFNSKRELFDAAFARRADVVNTERLEALTSLATVRHLTSIDTELEAAACPLVRGYASETAAGKVCLAAIRAHAETQTILAPAPSETRALEITRSFATLLPIERAGLTGLSAPHR